MFNDHNNLLRNAYSHIHAHGMNDLHEIKTAVGKSHTVTIPIKALELKDVP